MTIKAPFFPYEKLRQIADRFLEEYHPSGLIPVPIEKIVEFRFGIDIIETPGLHDLLGVDAFPTSDLMEFWIDQFIYRNRPNRYRFSLAHEISHVVLHKDIFEKHKFKSIDEWKHFVEHVIPSDQYSWIEWQAYALAGLILVPSKSLREIFDERIETAANAGLTLEEIRSDEDARITFEKLLARPFEVSSKVIEKRIDKDGLWL